MSEARILTDEELRQIGALQVTPGTWVVEDEGEIRTEDGCLIARVHPHGNIRTVMELGETYSVADGLLIGAAPDLRRTALHLLRDRNGWRDDARRLMVECAALRARVTELEAPGECQSLHKLRAEVERLKAELTKPVAGAWEEIAGVHGRWCLALSSAVVWCDQGGWWVRDASGVQVASGSETGEEGRRLADAAAVAAGWRLL